MALQNIILLIGPPGSGKGTQSRLLVDKLGYGYFSMGDTLREYAKTDTDLGRKIKNIIDTGSAVNDDIATKVFEDSFKKTKFKSGVIIDGYPRSVGQVESLNKVLQELGAPKPRVVLLEVDKQKLFDRLLLRSKKEGRTDDSAASSIEKRFEEYNNKTSTAVDYYKQKGLLISINGDQPIEAVHQEILPKLP